MLDDQERRTHARAMGAALRAMGPTELVRVLGMLRGLGLTHEEALSVVQHGRKHGILVAKVGMLEAGAEADIPGLRSQSWPPAPYYAGLMHDSDAAPEAPPPSTSGADPD